MFIYFKIQINTEAYGENVPLILSPSPDYPSAEENMFSSWAELLTFSRLDLFSC